MPEEGVDELEDGAEGVAFDLALLSQRQLDVTRGLADLAQKVDQAELPEVLRHAGKHSADHRSLSDYSIAPIAFLLARKKLSR